MEGGMLPPPKSVLQCMRSPSPPKAMTKSTPCDLGNSFLNIFNSILLTDFFVPSNTLSSPLRLKRSKFSAPLMASDIFPFAEFNSFNSSYTLSSTYISKPLPAKYGRQSTRAAKIDLSGFDKSRTL